MELKSIINKNKKGASSFEGWTEGVIFSIMFVIILGTIVLVGMNDLHNKNYEIEGLETAAIQDKFESYQESQSEKLKGGDATFTSAVGLTVSTSWDVLLGALTMVMTFVTGGWVETLVAYLHLPSIVGYLLRGLWITALGFIILGILFSKRNI